MTALHYVFGSLLKDRHMTIYFIAASELLQKIWYQAQYSLSHDSIQYSVVFTCVINPTHAL